MKKLGRDSIRPAIRQGGVFWVEDVPPLDGQEEKSRWVIVVDDNESLKAGVDPIIVVCCSASVTDRDFSRIPLPNKATTPDCRTGLPRQCWAIPRWYLPMERSRLSDYRGYLSGRALREVLAAYVKLTGG